MKLIHMADLHLGKRVNEFSMIEDQEYILKRILEIVEEEKPDAILIAGDVYDKALPSAQAVTLLDFFLTKLAQRKYPVFLISGNHDSAERIAFGSRLMEQSGIHMSEVYNGCVTPIPVSDEYGTVNFYLLPFVKPIQVRSLFEEEEITSYTQAAACAIRHMPVNLNERNVLITHQFVTGAVRCDSEEVSVGGSDQVDASVFQDFDYVALGHIHSPQNIGSERIRYSGTPLKYSFSEVRHHKSLTIVEMKEKGNITVRARELKPRREMAELRGTYQELTNKKNYETYDRDAYLRIILTDEEEEPDAIGKLRVIYPNIMRLEYDNRRSKAGAGLEAIEEEAKMNPSALFEEFYETQNHQSMTEQQKTYLALVMEQIWEEKEE